MKKMLSIILTVMLILGCSACGNNREKSIVGKWYNEDGSYLEVLSDNTYLHHVMSEYGDDTIRYSGDWSYLEEEEFYKFFDADDHFVKVEIKDNIFGTYIEYGYHGKFYKNEFPKSLETVSVIECPNFIGMTVEQVKQSEYSRTFNIIFEYEDNDEYPVMQVCSQSEKEGKKLKKDATITLTVSKGTR